VSIESHGTAIDGFGETVFMKGKYVAAAGVAVVGFAVYYFFGKRKAKITTGPQKESERHHLTNAFARAKQVATGRS
jgi:hypothetical protein